MLNQNKIWYGEAGYAISKLCTSQVTKNMLVDVTWDAVVHQVKPAINENWTITLCWAPYMHFTMPMNLYFVAGHAMSRLCTGQTAKTLK